MNPAAYSTNAQTSPQVPAKSGNCLWYALQIQSRMAGIASDTLCGKGYETFHPSYDSRRRWSDRIKIVKTPLFPGYLFCRFNVQHTLPILTTPGFIGIVGAGGTPIAVADHEIAAVRTVLHSGLTALAWPFSVGSKVSIVDGPLAGVEGILINADKVDRLVVTVTLLQRSVAVAIDREWARPTGHKAQ